jgi:hypothetical protein
MKDDMFEESPRSYPAPPRVRAKKHTPAQTAIMPYKIGDVVQHPEFGVGVVTAKSGELDSLRIRVAFQGIGSKLLAVKYAQLKKVE